MSRLYSCFQCSDPVLELVGQDVVLKTVYLRPESSGPDQEILDAGAYGGVHLKCFVGSRWASVWAARIRENMEGVRGFPVLSEADGLVLLRHEVLSTRRTIAIRDDGWHGYLDDSDLRARRTTPGGVLLPVRDDCYLEVSDYGAKAAEIVRALHGGATYPLLGLVDALGLRRRLWSDAALERARLEPRPDVRGDADGEIWIEAVAVYEEFVPAEVLDRVLAVLPDARAQR